ncbi:CCA tRNA nucleotidyltransferase [Parachlamydia sp. AcF125]|uniref:CCA tRNA nucleotidyltransferase n=1 Tax=Parachlamydia sp. AcF125 TaxID=2795736 RepID=UPI001BC8F4A3|nr:CCA tRNA nucleotidyltransferase [Parachlamydia sp. AcF125]MBS4167737.1 CCA-adding enzyme [Parachlamydia sp. AcF125]
MDEAQIHATEIVKKLVKAGYIAYFAGGWVRDYLMGHPSADIDIATNAPPEKILDLFPHTLLVGLAFGVVIVLIEGHQFEVSTFRQDFDYEDGRKPSKIQLSTPQEDAQRRDFTINGLFYDPLEETIFDYVHGVADLQKGIIRTIGNPQERFFEDRLRMVRAIRFASRFGFTIDVETQEAIIENAPTLFPSVAMERIWQEFCKMSHSPSFDHALIELHRLQLLPEIFPILAKTHLNDIKQRVKNFPFYPRETPTVLYLVQLFAEHPLSTLLDIFKGLKTSNRDCHLIEVYLKGQTLLGSKNVSERLVEWAHYYALPEAQICLEVLTANGSTLEERSNLASFHAHQKEKLRKHIERIRDKNPLVSSTFLREQGIMPSKQMGLLLKQAEEIAILNNLENPQDVLLLLKQSSTWPV